jgi:hypothetical protein
VRTTAASHGQRAQRAAGLLVAPGAQERVHAQREQGGPAGQGVPAAGAPQLGRGAEVAGGAGWLVVDDRQGTVTGDLVRDEAEPERYFEELLDHFDRQGVEAAFWFTFAGYQLPHRPADPRHDLDLASYGLVAVLESGHGTRYPDMAWEPKRLFDTLAARYAGRTRPGR